MTSREFKDWFEGYVEGSDAKTEGLTKEQVNKIMEVAKACDDTAPNLLFGSPTTQVPYTYTYPNTTNIPITSPAPYSFINSGIQTSTAIDVPTALPLNQNSQSNSEPDKENIFSATSAIGTAAVKTFVPENRSGSKADAIKLIQGLKMRPPVED